MSYVITYQPCFRCPAPLVPVLGRATALHQVRRTTLRPRLRGQQNPRFGRFERQPRRLPQPAAPIEASSGKRRTIPRARHGQTPKVSRSRLIAFSGQPRRGHNLVPVKQQMDIAERQPILGPGHTAPVDQIPRPHQNFAFAQTAVRPAVPSREPMLRRYQNIARGTEKARANAHRRIRPRPGGRQSRPSAGSPLRPHA